MSYTDILIEPERSAILTERISWPSLVFVGRLISKTMNITLRSFIPGFKLRMSVNSPMIKRFKVCIQNHKGFFDFSFPTFEVWFSV